MAEFKYWEAVFKIKGININENMIKDQASLEKVINMHNASSMEGNKIVLIEITQFYVKVQFKLLEKNCSKGKIDVSKYFANYITRPLYKIFGWQKYSNYPNTLFVTHSCEELQAMREKSEERKSTGNTLYVEKAVQVFMNELKEENDVNTIIEIVESMEVAYDTLSEEQFDYLIEKINFCLDTSLKKNKIKAAKLLIKLSTIKGEKNDSNC